MRINTAPGLPPAPAKFAHGVISGGFLQVSGQGPLAEDGTVLGHLSVAEQTTVTLEHVARVLEAGGASFRDVMMLRVYLTDRDDFAEMNAAFNTFIDARSGGEGPARTTLITQLPFAGMKVEIDALAVVPEGSAA